MPGMLKGLNGLGQPAGYVSGYTPGGAPAGARNWFEAGYVRVPEGKTSWHGRDTRALVEINSNIHAGQDMKSYEDMLEANPRFVGATWVIAGSGPSLRQAMRKNPRLYDVDDRVVWIAVNGGIRHVNPTLYMVTDRAGLDPTWWRYVPETPKEARPILVTSTMAQVDVLRVDWKDCYYFKTSTTEREDGPFEDLGWLESLYTVTGSAMDLAARAGARKIILLGIDCSLDSERRGYAYQVPGAGMSKDDAYRAGFMPVEGIDGKECWVNPTYWGQAHTLECAARQIEENCRIPVYNAGEQGILGAGVEWPRKMSFQDALAHRASFAERKEPQNGHDLSATQGLRQRLGIRG